MLEPTVSPADDKHRGIAESDLVLPAIRTGSARGDTLLTQELFHSSLAAAADAVSVPSRLMNWTQSETKICKDCNLAKPRNEFSPRKVNRDGLEFYCRKCANLRRGESQRKNLEGTMKCNEHGAEGMWINVNSMI
jgi:hypothetical protein